MAHIAEGAIIAGKYRLERVLARGGMGSVWIARHLQLDTEVALKLIAPEHAASADARMRFEREAKASAQLRTRNVVQVFDYGVDSDIPYIAMERLEGEDLETRLKREGRISTAAIAIIVNQVCRALRRAHEMGLVHRDLKPGNIFLARQDGEEVVKILDFGIAKDTALKLTDSATKTGTLLGSPYYMSPEQVRRSKDADPRSDLWSLGIIIFRCLTGQIPYKAEEIGELFLAICSEDLPRASQVAPDLSPAVDQFLVRALARNPAERFQSADEFNAAFAVAVNAPRVESSASFPFHQLPQNQLPPQQLAPIRAVSQPSLTTEARPPDLQGATSTFSPMGNSLVVPAVRRPRIGLVLALGAGGILVLGLITWSVFGASDPVAPQVEMAASGSPIQAPEITSASSAASPTAAPSASATTAPTITASAAPLRRAPLSTPRNTPTPTKKTKTTNDPTRHM